jgi:hypothetical protein
MLLIPSSIILVIILRFETRALQRALFPASLSVDLDFQLSFYES